MNYKHPARLEAFIDITSIKNGPVVFESVNFVETKVGEKYSD